MNAEFSVTELAQISGGTWHNQPAPETLFRITTDTRQENCGKIFFAFSGERFDAHDFLGQAIASGCAALCVSRTGLTNVPADFPVLLVNDTLAVFQKCAAFHRRRFPNLMVFGVTGSVGKTSVKEMLRAICIAASNEQSVLCTAGNTNNQIGVAQNLLRLNTQHRYAVLEAGTSSPGEIAPLAKMIQPHGAIVNSIAPCHLKNLLSLEGVAQEKSALLQALGDNGTAVFPAECAGFEILQESARGKKAVTFGMESSGDVSAVWHSGSLDGSSFSLIFPDGKRFEIHWELTGRHNALNAAGAAALASSCGISPEIIAQALPQTKLPGMRMKRSIVNGTVYFNDAYNANPASMSASLRMLAASGISGRIILVLGGMRELGEISREAHQEITVLQQQLLPDAITITCGKEFSGISPLHFDDTAAAAEYLQKLVRPGDTVFAKGSRGNAVENVLPPEAR